MAISTNVRDNLQWIVDQRLATKSSLASAAQTSRAHLDRVLKGTAFLDSHQIDAIASHVGLPAEIFAGQHSLCAETIARSKEFQTVA